MLIILIQIAAIVFAYASGRHDVPAVDNFTFYGSNDKHQSDFHKYNWIMKLCFVVACSLMVTPLLKAVMVGVCSGLLIWVIFDPVVSVFRRERKDFFYLSDSNVTDRTLLSLFGKPAGKVKFFACLFIVCALNYLMTLI